MNIVGKLIFFVIFLLFPGNAPAQEWVHEMRAFGVEDGLPHRNVKVIFIDRDGMLWAATNFELSRFDGSYLKVYDRQNLGDAVVNISRIAQDDSGKLWLWGARGLYLFDPDAEVVDRVENLGPAYSPANFQAPNFPLSDRQGNLFFNPSDQAILMTARNGKITTCRTLPYSVPFNLLAITANGLWARSAHRLLLLDKHGQELRRFLVPEMGAVKNAFVSEEEELFLFVDNAEEGQIRQLLKLDKGGNKVNLSSNWGLPTLTNVFFEVARQVIWMEMEGRWEIRNLQGKVLKAIVENEANEVFFAHSIASWMQATDLAGNLWLSTEHGVIRLSSGLSPFKTYFKEGQKEGASIRGIWSNGHDVIASAELDGVLRARRAFPPDTLAKSYNHYIAGRGLRTNDAHKIQSDYRGLYRDDDGYFWLGHQRVILRYDESDDRYRTYPPAFRYDVDAGINPWCFQRTRDGTMWVGAQPGLKYIPPEGDSLLAFVAPEPYEMLNDAAIYQFYLDANGYCWMATSAGLFCLNDRGELTAGYHSSGDDIILSHDHLYGLSVAGDGKFWLATNGRGLILFDPHSGKERHWTLADGLSDEVIYSVHEDRLGYLWLSSDYGLMRMDTGQQIVHTFLAGRGVTDNEFNRVAHFETSTGELLFGTVNGLLQLDPNDFNHYTYEPVPEVKLVHFSKKSRREDKFINFTKELRSDSVIYFLPEDETFQLTLGLAVFQKNKPEFFYRLNESEWTKVDGHQLRLKHLPYGEHTLFVKGKILGGRFANHPLTLKVKVIRPFYLRAWFLLSMIIAIAAIIHYAIWLRTQQLLTRQQQLEVRIREATVQLKEDRNLIKQQAEELAQVDQMKTRFFANISHELRTPLTLIMGPLSSMRKRKNLKSGDRELLELAEENSRDLLQRVNDILDLAKLDINGLEVKLVDTDVYQLCKQIIRKFDKLAQTQKTALQLNYQCDPEVHFRLDKQKITTILTNLISNALKFTGDGDLIKFTVTAGKKELIFSVEDSGTGIPHAELPFLFDRFFQSSNNIQYNTGSGIGLALCKELTVLMGGDLRVESVERQGSIFTLYLPQYEVEIKQFSNKSVAPPTSPSAALPLPTVIPVVETEGYLMVVEDNPGMRSYVASLLKPEYQLQLMANGREALDFLEKQTHLPALIITDLMMPQMDGLTLIQCLKSQPDYHLIPLIVLSARSTATDRVEVLRYGVDDYLEKPFDAVELSVRISRLLENARQRLKAKPIVEDNSEILPDTPHNSSWLGELEAFVIGHLSDNRLSATFLADAFHLSSRQLQRRLIAEAGVSPGNYIREVRLNEAMKLLKKRQYPTVKEVAAHVGFRSPEYFSSSFRNRFGRVPSSYL